MKRVLSAAGKPEYIVVSRSHFAVPRPRPTGFPDFEVSAHPALPTLQWRAAIALFARLEQHSIPAQYARLLHDEPNPAAALVIFARSLGLNVDNLRSLDAGEIARLSRCVDLLTELAAIDAGLDDDIRHAVQDLLYGGNIDAAADLVAVASALITTLDMADAMSSAPSYREFVSFIARVRFHRRHMYGVTPRLAKQLLTEARVHAARRRRLGILFDRSATTQRKVVEEWPGNSWGLANERRRDDCLNMIDEVTKALHTAIGIDLDEHIALLHELVDELDDLLRESRSGRKSTGSAGGDHGTADDTTTSTSSPIDMALEFFGFARGTRPSDSSIKKARRDMISQCHPDRATDDDDHLRRTEILKTLNQHTETLRASGFDI